MLFKKFKQILRRNRLIRNGANIVKCTTKANYGDNFSGWYVDTALLKSHSIVYSVGVGANINFDIALIDGFGLTVHAFDPTPRSIEWVKQQKLSKKFIFHDYGLADFDGQIEFFPPAKPSSTHFSPVNRYGKDLDEVDLIKAPVKKLNTICKALGHDHIDLLKMDIEGGEYKVIDDLLASNITIGQILVEFHHMFKTIDFQETVDAIAKLKKAGYELFHISERTYEFSFRLKNN